jgi:hypothetical protein
VGSLHRETGRNASRDKTKFFQIPAVVATIASKQANRSNPSRKNEIGCATKKEGVATSIEIEMKINLLSSWWNLLIRLLGSRMFLR